MTSFETKIPIDCTLKSVRLTLRPPEESDFPVIRDIFSDPVTMEHLKFMAYLDVGGWTLDQVREKFNERKKLQAAQSAVQFVIIEKDTGFLLGSCSFPKVDLHNRNAEFGIIIFHSHWKRGISAECHLMCLSYAFEKLGLHRVEFRTIPANTRMRSFFQKFGISFEFVRKQAIFENGEFLDEVVYSLLAPQWPMVKDHLLKRLDEINK